MNTPPEVRLLPMSTEEFDGRSVDELQKEFFVDDLPTRPKGQYRYYTYGLRATAGSIVLFQYRGVVVASAVFEGRERFPKAKKKGYQGALHFDTESIRVFDPVGADIMKQIWPKFRRFSQAKQSLDPQRLAAFESKLKNVEGPSV